MYAAHTRVGRGLWSGIGRILRNELWVTAKWRELTHRTKHTYAYHNTPFVRWLHGDFKPMAWLIEMAKRSMNVRQQRILECNPGSAPSVASREHACFSHSGLALERCAANRSHALVRILGVGSSSSADGSLRRGRLFPVIQKLRYPRDPDYASGDRFRYLARSD